MWVLNMEEQIKYYTANRILTTLTPVSLKLPNAQKIINKYHLHNYGNQPMKLNIKSLAGCQLIKGKTLQEMQEKTVLIKLYIFQSAQFQWEFLCIVFDCAASTRVRF